jgi:hypothetical protein
MAEAPYRDDDPEARVAALRQKLDLLSAELARAKQAIAAQSPWRWRRFLFGLALPLAAAVLVAITLLRCS